MKFKKTSEINKIGLISTRIEFNEDSKNFTAENDIRSDSVKIPKLQFIEMSAGSTSKLMIKRFRDCYRR